MKYDPATRTYNLPRIRGEEATVEGNNDGVLHDIPKNCIALPVWVADMQQQME